jgi:hypothetical protein
MTDESNGEKPKKPPERADALNVPLPFEDAIKAALETNPPVVAPKKRKPKKV